MLFHFGLELYCTPGGRESWHFHRPTFTLAHTEMHLLETFSNQIHIEDSHFFLVKMAQA